LVHDDDPVVDFAVRTGETVQVDGVVPEPDDEAAGRLGVFLTVEGMHSTTCESFLESVAMKLDGVRGAEASYVTESIRVTYDSTAVTDPDGFRDMLVEELSVLGYSAASREKGTAEAAYEADIEDVIGYRYAAGVSGTATATASWQVGLLPGSYDLLEGVNVHLYCPVGGVFSVRFKRYTPDGHKLLDCEALLSVTNNDGRWAIQVVSTIFHERGYEDNHYPDAEASNRLGRQGYLAAFGYRDEATLNNLEVGRGSYEPRLPTGTPTASVSFGYSPRARTDNARNNRPMDGWVTDGVTSRLRVSEVTPPDNDDYDTNLEQFVELAGGTVGDYGYTRINPDEPLVIHATHDKAHLMGGYWRYTPGGVLISETRSVSIRIRKAGNWGSAGSLGQVTHHDRSNSV
jgi:copper chaperone CopZ